MMKVLVFAPHPDDEVLGAGGTMAKRAAQGDEVYVCVVTKGCAPLFDEAYVKKYVQEECRTADRMLGAKETIFLDFPAVMLETVPRYEFNGKIAEVVSRIKPDEVYLPHRGDMRPKYQHVVKRIYAYETVSETGWDIPNTTNEFIPNVYEDISDTLEAKMSALNVFKSQMEKYPGTRSIEAIEALARYRGTTVGVKAAEAFVLIREIKKGE